MYINQVVYILLSTVFVNKAYVLLKNLLATFVAFFHSYFILSILIFFMTSMKVQSIETKMLT